jgi:magnesium transporter
MTFYRFVNNTVVESEAFPAQINDADYFIICRANDVSALLDVFGWDKKTLLECNNLDETVCYTSYFGYDFISMIYVESEDVLVHQREINLFFSKHYLVLVIPNNEGVRLTRLVNGLRKAAVNAAVRQVPLVNLYYAIFNAIVADFSETLEKLEDEIESLAEAIVENPCHEQLSRIGRLRKTTYTYKKILRSLSYLGEQILMDENQLLDDHHTRYFRNIDARLMKQYDFVASLYDLSNSLLHTYDSKNSAQTSETMNKLAAITLIIGPMTIIAGIYGMNFTNMPELEWTFGYPIALGIMASVGLTIFLILKRKKWL